MLSRRALLARIRNGAIGAAVVPLLAALPAAEPELEEWATPMVLRVEEPWTAEQIEVFKRTWAELVSGASTWRAPLLPRTP